MWIMYALGSAFFAGVTSILAKCGIEKMDATVATAIRTIVVWLFSWLMVFVVGSQHQWKELEPTTILFLTLSGGATGASWLCYFKALQLGDVNKVLAIDKLSIVLTILLSFLFFEEALSGMKVLGIVQIAAGSLCMLEPKAVDAQVKRKRGWLFYAVGSAGFASLTSILGKMGIAGVESNLGTALRTGVVLVMAWGIVIAQKKRKEVRDIPRREWIFLVLSGLATGISWLCYYRALQQGPASVVVPLDKLSILVTVFFSRLVFHERVTKRVAGGLVLIVSGTWSMLLE